MLVVVDQPASIGALPLAVARDMGCPVAYLPGLTMRRIADLYPGEAKPDEKDAFIIADASHAMPHTLRANDRRVGDDHRLRRRPGRQSHPVANRLHGPLTQIHPSLERVLGPRLQHPAVLTLLERFGSPAQIHTAGRRLVALLRPKAPRMAQRLVEDIFDALDEQTVVVPGTEAAALIVPSLAGSLTAVLEQRRRLAGRIEELLEVHPLSKVLTSMPGVGVRTGARILIEVGDDSTFPTAGHLAAYAGLASETRSSGSSFRGEQPSRRVE
ncbi:transposase [Streptomyces sp. PvR034]